MGFFIPLIKTVLICLLMIILTTPPSIFQLLNNVIQVSGISLVIVIQPFNFRRAYDWYIYIYKIGGNDVKGLGEGYLHTQIHKGNKVQEIRVVKPSVSYKLVSRIPEEFLQVTVHVQTVLLNPSHIDMKT